MEGGDSSGWRGAWNTSKLGDTCKPQYAIEARYAKLLSKTRIGEYSPVWKVGSRATHRDPKTPPHWLAYITTSKCDATAAKAALLGAKLLMAPTTFENVGRMAIIADPQGAVFAIFQSGRTPEHHPPV